MRQRQGLVQRSRGALQRVLATGRPHPASPPRPIDPAAGQVPVLEPVNPSGPTASQHHLVILALGPTEVWVRGKRIERWASRRGLAILRYLVLQHPLPVHREKLMNLLWPHSSARSARNNLNVAMHGLRRSLEAGGPGPYVVFKDGCYGLASCLSIWLDVEEVRSAWDEGHALRQRCDEDAAERRFGQVVSMYRGELFADDGEGEWYLPIRRRLEDQYTESLELLSGYASDRGDHVRVVELCDRLLVADPCRETAHRLLMVTYAVQGRHHLAARQYANCVSSLQEHLDIAPHEDTTSAFLQLLQSRR